MKKVMVKIMRMNCNPNNTYAICYDTLYVFNSKDSAKKYFTECYYMSEGAEQQRYTSILFDLNNSNIGKDNVSFYCDSITIEKDNKYLNLSFVDITPIDETIKYYEEIIVPILEISNNYEIDFNDKIPFEYFGSDDESYTNTSFSNYYKDILEKFNINVKSIQTDSTSDGKYVLTVNDEVFDIKAWDGLQETLDNVDSMIETLKKENSLEV